MSKLMSDHACPTKNLQMLFLCRLSLTHSEYFVLAWSLACQFSVTGLNVCKMMRWNASSAFTAVRRKTLSSNNIFSQQSHISICCCRCKICTSVIICREPHQQRLQNLFLLSFSSSVILIHNTQRKHSFKCAFSELMKYESWVSWCHRTPQMFILSTIFCNQIYFGDRNRVYRYVHVFYAHCVTLVVQFKLETTEKRVLVWQSFTETLESLCKISICK